jgi:predicted nuclease with TOPRIM domain
MEEGLKLKISADLGQTIAALREMQREVAKTGAGATKLGDGVKGASNKMPQLAKNTGQANIALVNFGRVVQDAPFGLIGIANNIDPLISSFQSLKRETGSAGAAFKGLAGALMGPAGIAIAVSAVTSSLIAFGPQIKNFITGTKELSKAQDDAVNSITQNYTQVLLLSESFKRAQGNLEERKNVIQQLNKVSSEYFGNLNAEKSTVEDLKKSYDDYINNLLRSFAVKQLESDLEPLVKRLAIAQSTINKLGKDIKTLNLGNIDLSKMTEDQRKAFATSGVFKYNAALREQAMVWDEINKLIEGAMFLTEKKDKKTVTSTASATAELQKQLDAYKALSIAIGDAVSQYNSEQESLRLLLSQQEKLRKGGEKPGDLLTPQQQLSIVGSDDAKSNIQKLVEESNKLNKSFELTDELINTVGNEFANLFSNISKDGTKAFEDFAKAVAETTTRILINYAVTQALKSLIDSIAPGVGTALDSSGLSRAAVNELNPAATLRADQINLAALRGVR